MKTITKISILVIFNLIIFNLHSITFAQYTDNYAANFNGSNSYVATQSRNWVRMSLE